MAQPAVSKSITDLERMLGVRLLDRSRQGVEPTAYGAAFLKRGVAVFDELRQGFEDIDFLSDPTTGEVRIGCTESIASAILSPIVVRLTQQYPRIVLHVVIGDEPAIVRQLAARSVDLTISRVSTPLEPGQSAEILFCDRLTIATGAKNPLLRRRKLTLADLADEQWVIPDNTIGLLIADSFRARGLGLPRISVSTISTSLRNELAATGRFLTAMPGFALRLPRRHPFLRALPLELPNSQHPVAIRTLHNRSLSPLAQLFCERVRAITKPLARP
jgi:DNA-binding transcriptional LysR family regulator